jgi:hypothetical protein
LSINKILLIQKKIELYIIQVKIYYIL